MPATPPYPPQHKRNSSRRKGEHRNTGTLTSTRLLRLHFHTYAIPSNKCGHGDWSRLFQICIFLYGCLFTLHRLMISHLIDITTLSLFHQLPWKTRSAPIATSIAGTLFPTTEPRPSDTSTNCHDGLPQSLQWLLSKKLWNYSQGQNNNQPIFMFSLKDTTPHHLSLPHKLLCIDVFVLNKNSDTKSNSLKARLESSCADYLFTTDVASDWCCPQRSCRILANPNVNHPGHLRTINWQIWIIYP